MIQFNLLPDVKLQYIKAQRQQRLAITGSAIVTIAAVALFVSAFSYGQLQKKHLNDLTKDIASESATLKNEPKIGRILTVQNQLNSLTTLHASKPAMTRLFDYLNQVTPKDVDISTLTVDTTTAQSITITGTADAIKTVNKYVDTLKFTTLKGTTNPDNTPAFTNVVLTSFGLSADAKDSHSATYTISLVYDKSIFDITQNTKLNVPNLITTRSELTQAADLFKAAAPATTTTTTTKAGN